MRAMPHTPELSSSRRCRTSHRLLFTADEARPSAAEIPKTCTHYILMVQYHLLGACNCHRSSLGWWNWRRPGSSCVEAAAQPRALLLFPSPAQGHPASTILPFFPSLPPSALRAKRCCPSPSHLQPQGQSCNQGPKNEGCFPTPALWVVH